MSSHAGEQSLFALSLFQSGQYERALVVYQGLLGDFPDSAAAKINVGLTLLKLGRATLARPLFASVVDEDPGHRRAWGYLGVALEQIGLLAEAEEAFLAGHYSSAAARLRDRHPAVTPTTVPELVNTSARVTLAVGRKNTERPAATAGACRVVPNVPRFAATLRPVDVVREERGPSETAPSLADVVDEIPFEKSADATEPAPPSMGQGPKQNRPVVPLLDAALSSLLVVPHEAMVVVHPTGLVVVGMIAGADAREGGFAARADTLQALAGELWHQPLPHRAPPSTEAFRSGFVRVFGTGQLVLAPPPGTKLMPVDMDADVAFLREDLVVAFDRALLSDLGRLRDEHGTNLSLVRFRGDGVIVLALESSFLAFDVHGDSTVSVRADSLVGWIGLLAPDGADADSQQSPSDRLITLRGEGTVLFRAPQQPGAS